MINRSNKPQKAKKLAEAFRPLRGAFIATAIFSFFINLLMFTAPIYMLQMYDRVLASRNEVTLVMLTVVAAGALVMFGLLELIRSRILVRIGARFDDLLNKNVFRAAFQTSVTQPNGASSQSLRDMDSVREFMTGQGLIAFLDAPWVPVFIAVVFLFHPILGFVALGGALIIFALALTNEFATRKPLAEASKANVGASNFVSTSLRNAEAVSAMGMLPGIMDRWTRRHKEVLGRQAMASDRAGTILAMSKSIRQFLQVAMLGVGGYLVLQTEITAGTMIAASILMGRALAPVEQAVGQWRGFVNARTAYQRLNQLLLSMDEEKERMQLPTPEGRLTVERIVVAPPGSRTPILKGVSFDVQPGEALGIIGPSGAGKSTLARALVGVWPIGSGHVRIDGADITDWEKEQLGPHLGYLPQDVELFDGTVAENIARFRTVDPDQVVSSAKLAGVHEMILQLPEGYDTQIGPGGQALSGGQRQRVALARAIYGDVRFVLLDEPNANLDTEGEKALTETIGKLREQGRTVAMITHRPPLLGNVDKVLALDSGQVQAFGPRQEVLNRFTRPAVVAGGGQGGGGQSGGGQGGGAQGGAGQGGGQQIASRGQGQPQPSQAQPSQSQPSQGQPSQAKPQGQASQGQTAQGQQAQGQARAQGQPQARTTQPGGPSAPTASGATTSGAATVGQGGSGHAPARQTQGQRPAGPVAGQGGRLGASASGSATSQSGATTTVGPSRRASAADPEAENTMVPRATNGGGHGANGDATPPETPSTADRATAQAGTGDRASSESDTGAATPLNRS